MHASLSLDLHNMVPSMIVVNIMINGDVSSRCAFILFTLTFSKLLSPNVNNSLISLKKNCVFQMGPFIGTYILYA